MSEIDATHSNVRKNSSRNVRSNSNSVPQAPASAGTATEKSAFGKGISMRVKAQLSLFQKRLVDIGVSVVFIMKLKRVLFVGKIRLAA